jgi:hypothetical protein
MENCRTNYRTGYLDAYDLHVFDNATVGEEFLSAGFQSFDIIYQKTHISI